MLASPVKLDLNALIIALIGAAGLILVAVIKRSGDREAAKRDDGTTIGLLSSEHHAHTRDLMKAIARAAAARFTGLERMMARMHDRMDAIEYSLGASRQQDQIGRSADALADRRAAAREAQGPADDDDDRQRL